MSIKHGANLFEIKKEYGFDIDDIKDFSSNIQPFGPSPKALNELKENLNKVSIYPDPNYDDLLTSIEKYTNISRNNLILSSGTTNLISSFISLINPKTALIFNPSYSEYKRELEKINANIISYDLKKEDNFIIDLDKLLSIILEHNIELVILTNPNNPTGFALENSMLEKILSKTNAYFMIDETYVEFADINIYSSINLTKKYDNLLVLRSTSKFFATAGIRLGYGITGNKKIYKNLNKNLNIWNINVFAEILGAKMFLDTEYQKNVFDFIVNEKSKMISELQKIKSLKVYPSQSNFLLCEIVDKTITAKDLREKLIQKALIIRDCKSFENLDDYFFRFCILDSVSNDKLIENINYILKTKKCLS